MKTLVDIQRLVFSARSGDKEAFGKLYDMFVDEVYRFVFFRVGNREDSEDISESVFVSCFEHIKEYEEKGLPFEAWVYRIARNKIIDHYRKRKPKVSLDSIQEMEDVHDGPEEKTDRSLTAEFIMKTLRRLPEAYQEIIILTYIEERGNSEISMMLDKPVAHVRVLQSRALQKLRTILNHE